MKYKDLRNVLADKITAYGVNTADWEVTYRLTGSPEAKLVFAIFKQNELNDLIDELEVDSVSIEDNGYVIMFKRETFTDAMLELIFRDKFKFSKTVWFPGKK